MKNLKTMLCTIVAIFGLTTVSNAASLNGVYLEASSSAVGVELDGSHTDAGADGHTVKGAVGKTAVTASYGLGYMTSRDNKLGLDVSYMWTPGEAKLTTSSNANSANTVTFELSDTEEYSISPMINITPDASLYLRFGWTDSDLTVTGDVTKPTSMDGSTTAIGTVMSWGSNLYIRTEAGMTDYDNVTATGLGTTIATTESAKADPVVHFGKIAIGYKF